VSEISAWLMSGAGNEFLVVDARAGLPSPVGELAPRLCPRPRGFGVDGLLAVESVEDDRVIVGFANADGSAAGFCGNGARCVGRFTHETGMTRSSARLRFPACEVEAEHVEGDQVRVRLEAPGILKRGLRLETGEGVAEVDLVAAGVPHLVLLADDVARWPLERVGPRLRHAEIAGSEGANVTVCGRGERPVAFRTFERGVEGVTGACGSGALAAAAVLVSRGLVGSPVELRPPSGRTLHVRLDGDGTAVLAGDARCRMKGVLPGEVIPGW
jgi:diaminopimelate epimerase